MSNNGNGKRKTLKNEKRSHLISKLLSLLSFSRPVCLSPPKTVDSAGHEVIGQTVILELQTQIGKLQDELDAKSNEVERVNGHVQVLNGQLSDSAKMGDEKTQQLMDLNAKLKEAKSEVQVRPLTTLF